jgi:hypothetical protein
LLLAKGLRAFADGLVSVVLPVYLLRLGYSAFAVGHSASSGGMKSSAFRIHVCV